MYKFIREVGSPFTKEMIYNLEKSFNVIMPESLKRYYLSHGNSKINTIQFETNKIYCDIASFVSIDPDATLSFYKILSYGKEDEWIPDNFYPFAYDSGGNYYFWNSNDYRVYIIYSDNIEKPYLIADSMCSFFNLINR